MILSTHAIAGGIIASAVSKLPIIGFIFGFCSHFALDAIPHWDYKLASKKKGGSGPLADDIVLNNHFILDLGKIFLDFLIGFAVIVLIHSVFRLPLEPLVIGGMAGVLPDFLQFIYFKTRIEPFISIQKFHIRIHSREKIKSLFWGVLSQAAIVLILLTITAY